jgi:hypothetical protein
MFEKVKRFFLFKNTKQQKIMYLIIWTIFLGIVFISIFDSFDDKVLLIILYVLTWIINLSLALLTPNHKD